MLREMQGDHHGMLANTAHRIARTGRTERLIVERGAKGGGTSAETGGAASIELEDGTGPEGCLPTEISNKCFP